jgi:hypothetical protein
MTRKSEQVGWGQDLEGAWASSDDPKVTTGPVDRLNGLDQSTRTMKKARDSDLPPGLDRLIGPGRRTKIALPDLPPGLARSSSHQNLNLSNLYKYINQAT